MRAGLPRSPPRLGSEYPATGSRWSGALRAFPNFRDAEANCQSAIARISVAAPAAPVRSGDGGWGRNRSKRVEKEGLQEQPRLGIGSNLATRPQQRVQDPACLPR